MAKKIDVAGQLNAATTEGIIADASQVRINDDSTVDKEVENLNANTGISEYETFSDQKAYSAGDTVLYNGLLYTFTTDHAIGAWDESQVESASLKKEVNDKFNFIYLEKLKNNFKNYGEYKWISNYGQYEKLPFTIPQNSLIELDGDLTEINGFTDITANPDTDLANFQVLQSGTVTDRDINFIRNKDSIGSIKIYAKYFNAQVIVPSVNVNVVYPLTNNIYPQISPFNIVGKDDSEHIDLPYIIPRNSDFDKISMSFRPKGYRIVVYQYDEYFNKLNSGDLLTVSSPTLTLLDNCKYLGFKDYVGELRYGFSMVNWGDITNKYESFKINNNELYQDIKETFNWDKVYSNNNPLNGIIQKGSRVVIYGDMTSVTGYDSTQKTHSTINNGDFAPFDIRSIRNLDVIGEGTINATTLEQQLNLQSKCINPIGKNIYCQYPIEGDDSTSYYVSMIERDFSQNKITLSKRGGSGYLLSVRFFDVWGNQIKSVPLSLNDTSERPRTTDIPQNCVYIKFFDYPPETRVGGTMVNYGEEILDYIPFETANIAYLNKLLAESKESNVKCLVQEPIIIVEGKESNIYIDDLLSSKNKEIYRKSILNSHFSSAANIGYVNTPAKGDKTGKIRVSSIDEVFNFDLNTKCIAKLSGRTINMLDIGSSYIDLGYISERQRVNYENDGNTVNMIGTMGVSGKRHEARSGGTWTFVSNPMGRAVILDVSNISNLPRTRYPGTTYMDSNGIKWTVRGLMINEGSGKLVLGPFSVDSNYTPNQDSASDNTDNYDTYAVNMPNSGALTKTTNQSTGNSTQEGDETIVYSSKELVYYNPFWNPATNELDFKYYITKWNFNTPDIVSFTFGSNDLGNNELVDDAAVETVVMRAKGVIDRLHSDYPNCKILLTSSCYGYAGYSPAEAYTPVREHNLQMYYNKLIKTFGKNTNYKEYLSVVPTIFMVDRENGFSTYKVTPCSLYDESIECNSDAIHPNNKGFYQYADAMLGFAYDLLS